MKRFCKYFLILCLIFCCSLIPAATAEASGIKQIEDLNSHADGPAKFMQDSYRDNYSLDVDKVFNGLANVIFSMVKSIAYAAINFFYRSLTFDITHYFSDIINTMQAFLKNSVFEPLLLLALFFSAVTVLKRFLQQNMVGILT